MDRQLMEPCENATTNQTDSPTGNHKPLAHQRPCTPSMQSKGNQTISAQNEIDSLKIQEIIDETDIQVISTDGTLSGTIAMKPTMILPERAPGGLTQRENWHAIYEDMLPELNEISLSMEAIEDRYGPYTRHDLEALMVLRLTPGFSLDHGGYTESTSIPIEPVKRQDSMIFPEISSIRKRHNSPKEIEKEIPQPGQGETSTKKASSKIPVTFSTEEKMKAKIRELRARYLQARDNNLIEPDNGINDSLHTAFIMNISTTQFEDDWQFITDCLEELENLKRNEVNSNIG